MSFLQSANGSPPVPHFPKMGSNRPPTPAVLRTGLTVCSSVNFQSHGPAPPFKADIPVGGILPVRPRQGRGHGHTDLHQLDGRLPGFVCLFHPFELDGFLCLIHGCKFPGCEHHFPPEFIIVHSILMICQCIKIPTNALIIIFFSSVFLIEMLSSHP